MNERVVVVGLSIVAVVLVGLAAVLESVVPLFAAWASQVAIVVVLDRMARRSERAPEEQPQE